MLFVRVWSRSPQWFSATVLQCAPGAVLSCPKLAPFNSVGAVAGAVALSGFARKRLKLPKSA
eukprot:9783786-Alexandrium_andersonii.AAC.1